MVKRRQASDEFKQKFSTSDITGELASTLRNLVAINTAQVADEPKEACQSVGSFELFNDENVSSAIRDRRKKQGLSETELAELAGVSRSTIQKVESGRIEINLKNLVRIMNAVGMELAWK